jgi:hypothetical protein
VSVGSRCYPAPYSVSSLGHEHERLCAAVGATSCVLLLTDSALLLLLLVLVVLLAQ